jgi:hypothetical protein
MFFAAALALTVPEAAGHILLDGRCDEPAWTAAAEIGLANGARLRLLHDADNLYVCALPAEGGWVTADVFLSQGDGAAIQLHASAQIGERRLDSAEEPAWQWGNHRGWYGTPLPLAGIARSEDGTPRIRWREDSHREMAIGKERFGPLPWRVRLLATAITAEGPVEAWHPTDSNAGEPASWLEIAG